MEEAKFNELKKEVAEGLRKLHLGGLKGEVLHEHLRAAATSFHIRRIEKYEMRADKIIDQLEEHIRQHLVSKAELDEKNAVHLIVRDYVYIYLTVHSILLYEKRDLNEIGVLANEFRKMCKKRALPEDVAKQVYEIMKKGADEWKAEFEDFRKILNSVLAKAEGRAGWTLTAFEKMHTEGYFVRYQERKRFRDALRNASKAEADVNKLRKVKTKDDLTKLFTSWYDQERNITNDYRVVAKLIFNTWDHITQQMAKLLETTIKATKIHELPARDQEQMVELHNLIVGGLEKKFLHALRIDDKQLEAIYSDVVSQVEEVRKAA
ncbi:hypothetical protein JW898_00485 [Candidatus Woesearchaeota archaeon]|nr:hypothetical protein [Candidatus Woesearchaeota archaeon]